MYEITVKDRPFCFNGTFCLWVSPICEIHISLSVTAVRFEPSNAKCHKRVAVQTTGHIFVCLKVSLALILLWCCSLLYYPYNSGWTWSLYDMYILFKGWFISLCLRNVVWIIFQCHLVLCLSSDPTPHVGAMSTRLPTCNMEKTPSTVLLVPFHKDRLINISRCQQIPLRMWQFLSLAGLRRTCVLSPS